MWIGKIINYNREYLNFFIYDNDIVVMFLFLGNDMLKNFGD